LGWLHATPKKSDKSRMEMYDEDDFRRRMPEVEAAYLLRPFFDSGMCSSNGMGVSAISWSELRNYCELTGTELSPWEAEQVMMMSRAYTASLRRSDDPLMPPPFTAEETDDEIQARRAAVVEQMMALKRSRKK